MRPLSLRSSLRSLLGLLVLVAAVTGVAGSGMRPARAESVDDEVEHLASAAVDAYKGARYEEAVRLLTRAYAIRPLSALLYNLARAEDKLGDAERAKDSYTRYVAADDADPKLVRRAQERIAALAEKLEAKRAEKAAAEARATPPAPPTAAARVDGGAAAAATVRPLPAGATAAPPEDAATERRHRQRVLLGVGIGTAALGVAAIGAGVGLFAVASGKHADFAASRDEADKRSLRDAAATPALLSSVMYGVGGALLLGSAWFFYAGLRTERSPTADAPRTARAARPVVTPWLSAQAAGGSAAWRF